MPPKPEKKLRPHIVAGEFGGDTVTIKGRKTGAHEIGLVFTERRSSVSGLSWVQFPKGNGNSRNDR